MSMDEALTRLAKAVERMRDPERSEVEAAINTLHEAWVRAAGRAAKAEQALARIRDLTH